MSSWIDAIFTKRTPSPSGSMLGVRGPSAPGDPMRAKLIAEALGGRAPVHPGDPECS